MDGIDWGGGALQEAVALLSNLFGLCLDWRAGGGDLHFIKTQVNVVST